MDWVIFWRNFIDEIADHIANLSKRGATGASGSIPMVRPFLSLSRSQERSC